MGALALSCLAAMPRPDRMLAPGTCPSLNHASAGGGADALSSFGGVCLVVGAVLCTARDHLPLFHIPEPFLILGYFRDENVEASKVQYLWQGLEISKQVISREPWAQQVPQLGLAFS